MRSYHRHLKLCHSMAEVNKVPAPKVRNIQIGIRNSLSVAPYLNCGVFSTHSMVKSVGKKNVL